MIREALLFPLDFFNRPSKDRQDSPSLFRWGIEFLAHCGPQVISQLAKFHFCLAPFGLDSMPDIGTVVLALIFLLLYKFLLNLREPLAEPRS